MPLSQGFLWVTVKLSARAEVSSEGLAEGGSASKLTYVVVGGIQFLTNHWSEGSGP